ncbi:hypothetical protein [Hymenobacter convexus]|uniref:hypothetical protein n=1 Tax=Hymenobacter sp. CA1UV-4 TaxID=3063782 RepID=UPI0027123F46|nr:hypothetical protein [Hymenobacter sp. CA1UV-4]MDO7851944.1 hypothetical protein [Hymenobacter sp. CA1UV-4]
MQHITFADRLKETSIRGRVAFSITCLEIYFKHLNLQDDTLVQALLEKLWEFTPSNSLDEWEYEITGFLPTVILNSSASEKFENVTFLKHPQSKAYQKLYLSLPETLVTMIDTVADIGFANLYAGTAGYSKSTFDETMIVIDLMNQPQLPLPDLSRFERSEFSKFHGWGTAVNKEFFAA